MLLNHAYVTNYAWIYVQLSYAQYWRDEIRQKSQCKLYYTFACLVKFAMFILFCRHPLSLGRIFECAVGPVRSLMH